MPDYNVRKDITVELILNEEESRWLKNHLQNYMGPPDTREGEESIRMRCTIFSTLKDALDAV
jgi:hypothetical protein